MREWRSRKIFWTCGKFSSNGYHEKKKKKKIHACKKLKIFRHLWKNLRELLIYKLLSENSFNLFCLLISLVCVLASKSLNAATAEMVKSLKPLILWHACAAFTSQTVVPPSQKSTLLHQCVMSYIISCRKHEIRKNRG